MSKASDYDGRKPEPPYETDCERVSRFSGVMYACNTHGDQDALKAWACPECMREARHKIRNLEARCAMLLDAHTGCGCGPSCKVCTEKGYT